MHEHSNERRGRHYHESELSRNSNERQLRWFHNQYGSRCSKNFQLVFDWYHVAHASQQHWVRKYGYLKNKSTINKLQSFLRCSESYIQVNGGERICGNRKTQLVYSKCGTSFKLNYFVGTKAYKGFKFFYECEKRFYYSFDSYTLSHLSIITIVTDVINPLQCVEPTEAPVDPTATTTKGVTPIWVTQSKRWPTFIIMSIIII